MLYAIIIMNQPNFYSEGTDSMTQNLISNTAIIISFLFIAGQIFKDKPIYSSYSRKIYAGVVAGFLGTVLMFFSIEITESAILDLRHFAISIAALFGGLISSVIASMIIVFSRITFWGLNISSMTATIAIFGFVLTNSYVNHLNLSIKKKLFFMTLINTIIVYGGFYYVLNDWEKLKQMIVPFGMINLFSWYLVSNLVGYINSSNENYRKLKEDSKRDFLTGLYNVRQFDQYLNRYIEKVSNKEEQLSLLYIDIDYFKKVNDSYGHEAGDYILKELSLLLSTSIRFNDLVFRKGGEEFTVVLPGCPHSRSLEIAEQIRKTVEDYTFTYNNKQQINITISVGVSNYPETIDSIEQLTNQADDFLYMAKKSGRNCVVSL